MSAFVDRTGQRIGRLTLLSWKGKPSRWVCRCDCGNIKEIKWQDLQSGKVHSCGCYKSEYIANKNRTHGHCHERLYAVWVNMKNRCYKPEHDHYKYYGGQGIKVCDEWLNDYGAFRKWAYANGYDENSAIHSNDCTIDRINPFEDYEPKNCRWANAYVQNNNQRKHWKGDKYVGKLNTL